MVRVNCHIHSNESDGDMTPREIVLRAVEEELDVVCFTDHAKTPGEIDIDDEYIHGDDYYEELARLRDEFKGRVEVLVGVEVDWIEGYEDWYAREVERRDYDFVLGSIHWLRDASGQMNRPHFPKGDLGVFGGEREFVERDLAEVWKMVEWGVVDSVAHLDIFRKRLEHPEILKEDWYGELILDLLGLMKERGIALEVNCVGWSVLEEQFPQKWIIEEAVKMGIGVTVGNDFHKLKFGRLDEGIDRVFEMLREVGAGEVLVFRGRKGVGLRI